MRFIDGPLYPIRLKIVSQKVIKKKAGREAYGVFVPSENAVYLANDQTPEQLLHTLVHEMVHVVEFQISHHDKSDDRADITATWMIRFFKPKTWEKLLE